MQRDNITCIVPTRSATERFNADLKAALPRTVWATGCQSWYLDAEGNPEVWPWTPRRHRELLADVEMDQFIVERTLTHA
jgi:hypothetical protein